LYGSLDISTSGMIAQRARIEAAAANIANADTVLDSKGQVNPYRARIVHFAAGNPTAAREAGRKFGVHLAAVEEDMGPFNLKWDPDSPYAFQNGPNSGYVPMPNVNTVWEQINAMEAARAYEANVMAAEATKAMTAQALRLIA
jgi:flagellar basal-body rod protein FlgC